MKVVLLNTPFDTNKIIRDMAGGLGFSAFPDTLLPPIDLAILAATLIKAGHLVFLLDPEVELKTSQQILEKIADIKPDIVIATMSLPTIDNDANFIQKIKSMSEAVVIAKIPISFEPIIKKFLKTSKADYGLMGETDLVISDIITGKTKTGTVRISKGKLVVKTNPPVEDVNNLPFPARDLLDNQKYSYALLGKGTTIMQTSRGCPFPCGYYCPYPLVQGKLWRAMTPERIVDEIREIVNKYKIQKVLFRDATFTLNRVRITSLCNLIKEKKIKFTWWCETRVNCLDEKLLFKMKEAGCIGINIGVETGNDEVMQKQGKPGVSVAQLTAIKSAADKAGIKLHFLLLIGLPSETRKTVYSTFKLIRKLRPYSMGVTVVTPYPGTELYNEALKKGWIESTNWKDYSGDLISMHTDNLASWEMKLIQKMIQAELFFIKKGIIGEIALVLEDIFFRLWGLL